MYQRKGKKMPEKKQKIRVGLVFGGRSGEHEVSLASATSVMANLDKEKYDVVPIGITKEGSWLLGVAPPRLLEAEQGASHEEGVEQRLGYPCFVKPVNLGSSVGVNKAHNREELAHAMRVAAEYDRKIIIERGINCRELECSVLGNDEPIASVVGEVVPSNEFYDYNAKYIDGKSHVIIPAAIPQATAEQVRRRALQAFTARDLSRLPP